MLLMAAEFRDPAEASLLNAQALAPGDMRWPYYLGHLYRAEGDIPNAMAAFERALRSAPNDVPTMIVARGGGARSRDDRTPRSRS